MGCEACHHHTRWWILGMIFGAAFTNYMGRVHFSLTIVAMVVGKGGVIKVPECKEHSGLSNTTGEPPADYGPRYEWDEARQGLLISSYFIGYEILCLPAGVILEFFGPKAVLFWSSIIQGIFTILSAPFAKMGWVALFIARFVIGIMGGLTYPAMFAMISQWAPPNEKGRFQSALMGNTIGTLITWPVVSAVTISLGWDWSFYILSIFSFVYAAILMVVASDWPGTHPFISDTEKNYIIEMQGGTVGGKRTVPPYKKIIFSRGFLALSIAQVGNLYGMYLIATGVPKFMSEVMGFNLKKTGFLAAAPYLARFICGFLFGWINDVIKSRELMSTIKIRRTFTLFSHVAPAVFLFMIPFVGCNHVACVAFIIMCQGFNGACVITHMMTPHDLAPNFASSLNGLMNFFAGFTGFIVPQITAAFNANNVGLKEWHNVFYVGATVYLCSGIFYMVFNTAELQKYNERSTD